MSPALEPVEPPYRLSVIWHRAGQAAPRSTGAAIIPGYTSLAELPDILAIRYLAGKREADQVVIDHACRTRRWTITARDTSGTDLGQVATDDEPLMAALAQVLLGAATAAGTIAQIEVHDTHTKTTNTFPAQPQPQNDTTTPIPTGPTVYLVSIADFDCYPDEYEAGGAVASADIDLNTAFEGRKEPRSEDEALALASNTVWQLHDFPPELRVKAHAVAARPLKNHPAALQALAALLVTESDTPADPAASPKAGQ
ncbi:hypothetical protein [Catenulispora rubra]|uniref:hypothetical protein n=1 Tax=Catenulispora rubra TaxID=280293 RepID=UPI001892218E|nr:hypothetical protein [Catenulispora rubra]